MCDSAVYIMSLDYNISTELSYLIPYIKLICNIQVIYCNIQDDIILLDNDENILSPSCKIIDLITIYPKKYSTIKVITPITYNKNDHYAIQDEEEHRYINTPINRKEDKKADTETNETLIEDYLNNKIKSRPIGHLTKSNSKQSYSNYKSRDEYRSKDRSLIFSSENKEHRYGIRDNHLIHNNDDSQV